MKTKPETKSRVCETMQFVELCFTVEKAKAKDFFRTILREVANRGYLWPNIPTGRNTVLVAPYYQEWEEGAVLFMPEIRTRQGWDKMTGGRKDIVIVTFILKSNGRTLEAILKEWDFLCDQGIYIGCSWGNGYHDSGICYEDEFNYAEKPQPTIGDGSHRHRQGRN